MAVSVDWATGVITVPKADTTLVDAGPPEIRSYDMFEKLWKDLKLLEASEEGIVFADTQAHNTLATVGGVTLAHVVSIINQYSLTFEAGAYRVNTAGANHNALDVLNYNAVQVTSANSAGLVHQAKLNELHRFRGLDADNPMVSVRTAGQVVQTSGGDTLTLSESPDNTVTSTRS